tara:strand:+ start:20730 stop:21845 length:1116 start_codon:yes stop_codon:yes gene_type:complete
MVLTQSLKRNGVLVLGMHRSGTSALTGVLTALGVASPNTLISGDEWNSRGYWESARINHFNERLLFQAGSKWNDWSHLNVDWLNSEEVAQFSTESIALLRSEFDSEELFAIKDPRICRIVPFWIQALRKFGASPSVILVMRHPVEVAFSLHNRDQMPFIDGVMLWLRSVLDAEHDSRGLRRNFTRYDDLLSDWRFTVNKLSVDLVLRWPVALDIAAPEIEKFISADLKHNSSRSLRDIELPNELSEWAAEVWEMVSDLAANISDDAEFRARFDGIRNEFDAYCLAMAGEKDTGNTILGASRVELSEVRKKRAAKSSVWGAAGNWINNQRRYWTARFLLLAAPIYSPEYAERLRRRLTRYEAQGRIKRKTFS